MKPLLVAVAAAGSAVGRALLHDPAPDPRLWLAGDAGLRAVLAAAAVGAAGTGDLAAEVDRLDTVGRATAAAVAALSVPSEVLLALGADDRVVPLHGVNSYGMPLADRGPVLRASSCTATPPDSTALAVAERWQDDALRGLLAGHPLDAEAARARVAQRLLLRLGLGDVDPGRVVLSPSGTDVESLVTALAAGERGVLLVVTVGAREAGGGTVRAAGLRRFRSTTPFAAGREVGAALDGADVSRLRLVDVDLRDAGGRVRLDRDVEAEIEAHVEQGLALGERVLVHVMESSKTSLRCPGPEWVRTWVDRHPRRLRVVVDAAQARSPRARLGELVAAGAALFTTGSKAVGGPPFCGALVLSDALLADAAARRTPLPAGLADAVARGDLPPALAHLADGLPPVNVGLLARWEVALAEADLFDAVPGEERRHVVRSLARGWDAALSALTDVEVLAPPAGPPGVVAFRVRDRGCGGEWLGREAMADLYAGITATRGVYLGQPVELVAGRTAVLRLAVGAPTVTRLLAETGDVEAAIRTTVLAGAGCVATALPAVRHSRAAADAAGLAASGP